MKRTGNSGKRNEAESVGYIGNSETNRKLEESGMVRWKGCCVRAARNKQIKGKKDQGEVQGRLGKKRMDLRSQQEGLSMLILSLSTGYLATALYTR